MPTNSAIEDVFRLSATEVALLFLVVSFVMYGITISNRIALFLAALLIAYVYINKIVKVSKRKLIKR
jgi:hypothetical protein